MGEVRNDRSKPRPNAVRVGGSRRNMIFDARGNGVVGRKSSSYGFYPQMKAEGMAFKKEKSVAVVVGTNPGFQMGVLIVYENDRNDCGSSDTED